MSAENPFSQLRKEFEAEQAEGIGKPSDEIDEAFAAFIRAEKFKQLPAPEQPIFPTGETKDITWTHREGTVEGQYQSSWSLRHSVLVGLASASAIALSISIASVGATNNQVVSNEKAREFGRSGELLDIDALKHEGVCKDELLASQSFHEERATQVIPESNEQKDHQSAAGRFGAAALLAQERSVSCYPQDAATWDISNTLTPNFDVYTLSLTGQCPPVIHAKLNAVDPGDSEARTRLELQAKLSTTHQIKC